MCRIKNFFLTFFARIKKTCAFAFLLFSYFLSLSSHLAYAEQDVAIFSTLELRDAIISSEAQHIASMRQKKISSSKLGEWQAIIEDSLFDLIRRTEVYRDTVSITVYEADEVDISILPNLAIFISSGLLGYIDEYIFLNLSDNLRRAKNINDERTLFFSSFVAFEVARFALDIDVARALSHHQKKAKEKSTTKKSTTVLLQDFSLNDFSLNDFSLVDEVASALLKVAGFSPSLMREHLERLKHIAQGSFVSSYPLSPFLLKNLDARLGALETSQENIEHLAEEVRSILFSLNAQEGLADLVQNISLLESSYPNSLYLKRLKALASHSAYLENITKLRCLPVLPLSILGHTYSKRYYLPLIQYIEEQLAKNNLNENTLNLFPSSSNKENEEKALKVKDEALSFYTEYLDAIKDDSMKDAYLALSNESSLSSVPQANASLCQGTLQLNKEKTEDFLKTGHYFDERLILYNNILHSLTQQAKTEDVASSIASLKKMTCGKVKDVANKDATNNKNLIIRGLKIGDNTDELTRIWGEPSNIVYNYYFERWSYRHLKAMAVISSYAEEPAVRQIVLFATSPASLQGNIRCGDERRSLEAQFGSPSYKAGDCDVYFYGSESICIFYSSHNIIKSILIFRTQASNKEETL